MHFSNLNLSQKGSRLLNTVSLVFLLFLFFCLSPAWAESSLVITTEPPGAIIFIDGTQIGGAPCKINTIAAGNHKLEARKQGYKPVLQDIVIEESTPQNLHLRLTPELHLLMSLVDKRYGTFVIGYTKPYTVASLQGKTPFDIEEVPDQNRSSEEIRKLCADRKAAGFLRCEFKQDVTMFFTISYTSILSIKIFDGVTGNSIDDRKLERQSNFVFNVQIGKCNQMRADIWDEFTNALPLWVKPFIGKEPPVSETAKLDSSAAVSQAASSPKTSVQNSASQSISKDQSAAAEKSDTLSPLRAGVQAPDFSLLDRSGRKVTLNQYLKKNICLICFWAADSTDIPLTLKILQSISKSFKTRSVKVIAIHTKPVVRLAANKMLKDITYPVLWDNGTIAALYGVKDEGPWILIVDRNGTIMFSDMAIAISKNRIMKMLDDFCSKDNH
ncbi:MAG: redoxin domain-containing protein [Firmicutes bacterium]|nr:redoxin domain-containing protein [Bacillota bacterium]